MAAQTYNLNAMNGGPTPNGRPMFGNPNFLDKKGLGPVRQSTPDSEVIEHSDEEHEGQATMSLSMHSTKSVPTSNVQRRPSWMSEVQSAKQQRKFSVGGASHASSSSQPTTPLGENGPWDTSNARSSNGNVSHMWTSQIWSSKDRPTRLHEVIHSPTSSFHEDVRSPTTFAGNGLPFEIPLEPTRKTIRSQSYSAGQLEGGLGMEHAQNQGAYRTRPIAHRPSRPSMLGDGQRDILGALREDDDDTEESSGSDHGYPLRTTTSLQSAVRGTALASFGKVPSPLTSGNSLKFQSRAMNPLSPKSENALTDEGDDRNDNFSDVGHAMARGLVGSNASSTTNIQSLAASAQNHQPNGGSRRSQWQTSLGFDVLEEGSQSRRHSFAAEQLPSRTRHNSMAATVDPNLPFRMNAFGGLEPVYASQASDQHGLYQQGLNHDTERKFPFHQDDSNYDRVLDSLVRIGQDAVKQDTKVQMNDQKFADSYFHGMENHRRNIQDASEGYNPFALPNVFSRPQRILYLVVFKCSRADIYYIPENTGLQVNVGDTVIVEGDRGQDLGTIEAVNVTMEQAKELKQEYLRKHYKCLMMFSRMYPHVVVCANDSDIFEAAIENSKKVQQQQLMNPAPGHGHGHGHGGGGAGSGAAGQGPYHEAEPRPKMIKRVARPDEVHLLREKEGNEAKAKRVCQGKVHDHGLRMEILDAEFQHDYRKLTFFFYAEEYTNFNELVTDLFKVYKTRIWMSAINPTSFHGGGNPHTGQRQALWPKQGTAGNALSLVQPTNETNRAQSPPEVENPATRGDREYQRLFGNTPFGSNIGYNGPVASTYEPRSGNVSFSPTASQFTPFASQYVAGLPGHSPWSGMASPMPQAYPITEAGNSDSTLSTTGPPGMLLPSQQSIPFQPRMPIGRGQHPSYNGRQHAGKYMSNAQPGAGGYPQATNGQRLPTNHGPTNHNINSLDDQFTQFSISPRLPQ